MALKAPFRFAEVPVYDRVVDLCSRSCGRGRVDGNFSPRCLGIKVAMDWNNVAFCVQFSCLSEGAEGFSPRPHLGLLEGVLKFAVCACFLEGFQDALRP